MLYSLYVQKTDNHRITRCYYSMADAWEEFLKQISANPTAHVWIERDDKRVIYGKRPSPAPSTEPPAWTALLPALLAIYERGNPAAKQGALEELQKMATAADNR